ncbi:16S rRNA (cytidine(1402)-2'-O)-methyltransferase [Helicobacter sp. 16-1353]|uniref:16S rRNA (cytidine(1402)-2'-O)-methyltransferase n=1 Tax=Helicobacter sp. 16-1353 TaxID=2004996 RepID=UPI000DCD9666|nr:16S rRNA (cytidine(1402)-2'-O)-methyltransferase [Helicobacter sp. 16-1353]RAX54191.1 16S rRNA (cytidine(1402)-2'-O)-methyltransferase [Helicobacter sp. 16-1353]
MLYLLATPIGNIADISIRGLEALESCTEILCEDTRTSKKLISLLNSRNLLKNNHFNFTSLHSHNEDSRLDFLGVDFFKNDVIFMSDAGMPCISDPGAKLVQFAQKHKIPYTIIPGASSVLSVVALSGFEGSEFHFHAFLPHKLSEKKQILSQMLENTHINIFFESTHRILESLEVLESIAPECAIFVAKEITKMHEKFYFGKVCEVRAEILNANINGEWAIALKNQNAKKSQVLSLSEVESLSIPPKIKAKIIAKITNKSIEECYNTLIKGEK